MVHFRVPTNSTNMCASSVAQLLRKRVSFFLKLQLPSVSGGELRIFRSDGYFEESQRTNENACSHSSERYLRETSILLD